MRPEQLVGRARRLAPPAILAAGLTRHRSEAYTEFAAGLGVDPAPQSGPISEPAVCGRFVSYGYARDATDEGLWRIGSEGLLFAFFLHGFAPLASYAASQRPYRS